MCGEVLEELTLPEHLEKVGAYAFHNCFHLKKLSCCSTVKDWGAGVFTGCTRITELDIRIFPEAKSNFKEILSELRQMLVVDYRDEQGKLLAKLIFPEFFEESIENTPARIIMREMHGCGHMYRYCFSGTDFQFWEYDKLLPTAEILESPPLLAQRSDRGMERRILEVYQKTSGRSSKGSCRTGGKRNPFLAGTEKRNRRPDDRADDPGCCRAGGCPGFSHPYGCKTQKAGGAGGR